MYSFEEAQKEFEAAEKDKPSEVVGRLDSFKRAMSLKKIRQPSFFQKMFVSTKLNRVHSEYFAFPESEVPNVSAYHHEADGDGAKSSKKAKLKKKQAPNGHEDVDMDTIATEEQEKRLFDGADEEKDDSSSTARRRKGNRSRPNDPDLSEISEEENSVEDDNEDFDRHSNEDDYPLMPRIGKPVNIDRLINRTKAAASGVRYLMEMMDSDVAVSIQRAKAIPVSSELDRVQVTPQISAVAAQVRSTAQVKEKVNVNMNEIQRNLNYRKSALIMMNVNYSHQRVRKIDPIYVQEARTIITYK